MRGHTLRNVAGRARGTVRVCARNGRRERGQTLLEFALAAPLLLVFLLAIVDFGIAIDRRIVLDHAVREGVRFASVGGDAFNGNPAGTDEVKQYTANQSQSIVGSAEIHVCYSDTNMNDVPGDIGDEVRVVAHYEHDFVTGFTSFFNLSLAPIVMEPSASARIEQGMAGVPAC